MVNSTLPQDIFSAASFLLQSLSQDMKGYCQAGVGDAPVDPYEQDGLEEEGSGDDIHLCRFYVSNKSRPKNR